jgi:hypothetical protein
MRKSILFYTLAVILLSVLFAAASFSEETKQPVAGQGQAQLPDAGQAQQAVTTAASPVETAPAPAIVEETPAGKELSIYGEVQSVNATANSITVQYYDYDSDEEKVVEIMADSSTRLENAAAIGNIAKADWVDATYVADNGKNVAKSILVEKEEKDEAGPAAVSSEAVNAGLPGADIE